MNQSGVGMMGIGGKKVLERPLVTYQFRVAYLSCHYSYLLVVKRENSNYSKLIQDGSIITFNSLLLWFVITDPGDRAD